MIIAQVGDWTLHVPTSGGKAGKGYQKTSSIQIRKYNLIIKQIRFVVSDPESRSEAITKARKYIGLK